MPLFMMQVALTLAEKVLSPPKQEVKVLNFDQVRYFYSALRCDNLGLQCNPCAGCNQSLPASV